LEWRNFTKLHGVIPSSFLVHSHFIHDMHINTRNIPPGIHQDIPCQS
jgi:hypothetical protein